VATSTAGAADAGAAGLKAIAAGNASAGTDAAPAEMAWRRSAVVDTAFSRFGVVNAPARRNATQFLMRLDLGMARLLTSALCQVAAECLRVRSRRLICAASGIRRSKDTASKNRRRHQQTARGDLGESAHMATMEIFRCPKCGTECTVTRTTQMPAWKPVCMICGSLFKPIEDGYWLSYRRTESISEGDKPNG
jgi:hypothetical protein